MANEPTLKNTSSALERFNPLLNLSIYEAQSIFDAARGGNTRRLQWLWDNMERSCPTLLLSLERRLSAISARNWAVNTLDDSDEAMKQKDLIEAYINNIDNLKEALEHLGMSFFRGFAFIEPVGNHWNIVDNVNLTRDLDSGTWYYWVTDSDKIEVPEGLLIGLERERPIDYPVMSIFLRLMVGEREYGRFAERYSLPPVTLTMPEVTDKSDVPLFQKAANDIADGKSGVVPFGTGVSFASEARGTDPFTAYLEYHQKEIVRLVTGGTLASISESGSGTLAGNAQMEVWRQLTQKDAELIADAVNKWLARNILGNVTQKAYFSFIQETTPEEKSRLLDNALKIQQMGFTVDKQWLVDTFNIPLVDDAKKQGDEEDPNLYVVPRPTED